MDDKRLADERIRASRRLFQNPYAYLDDAGKFSAAPDPIVQPSANQERSARGRKADPDQPLPGRATPSRGYEDNVIEAKVKALQNRLWRERFSLWLEDVPREPIDVLDPFRALQLLGYEHYLEPGLGRYVSGAGEVEVAGIIDRDRRVVRISQQFPTTVRTFTAAHELGHALLHKTSGVHRDRAMDAGVRPRDKVETEADKFATYFLMPAKHVRDRFASRFGNGPFKLDEDSVFSLACLSPQDFAKRYKSRRDVSRLLAGAERFGQSTFDSLAAQFKVSVETMAIRLEELGLIEAD